MMNGLAPAVLSTASTSATTFLMLLMPRLPTPTAICAPGCNRDRTFCALNSCWTTAGISSGCDWGNFCRTANMRGKGMGVLMVQRSFEFILESCGGNNPPRRGEYIYSKVCHCRANFSELTWGARGLRNVFGALAEYTARSARRRVSV